MSNLNRLGIVNMPALPYDFHGLFCKNVSNKNIKALKKTLEEYNFEIQELFEALFNVLIGQDINVTKG